LKISHKIKSILIKLCKRIGETSPILINWSEMYDLKPSAQLLDTMRISKDLIPTNVDAPSNQDILILAPHPDDEVIGMGGTLIQMIQNNCRVKVLYITLSDDEALVKEATDASKNVGYEIEFLGLEKRNISLDTSALEKFAHKINMTNAKHLFIPFMLDDHDDHRRVSELLQKAYHQGLIETKFCIWAYQVYTALPLNSVVDITNVISKKIEAIRYYRSQFKSRDWAHFAQGLNAFNMRFLSGRNDASYAEVFFRASLKNYIKMCDSYFGHNSGSCYELQSYKN
tara:strand:+ start:681 stop:1532 length:852 start_codon:yes stop_codon:yes gene_type:complete